jgi:hypothetical protein
MVGRSMLPAPSQIAAEQKKVAATFIAKTAPAEQKMIHG